MCVRIDSEEISVAFTNGFAKDLLVICTAVLRPFGGRNPACVDEADKFENTDQRGIVTRLEAYSLQPLDCYLLRDADLPDLGKQLLDLSWDSRVGEVCHQKLLDCAAVVTRFEEMRGQKSVGTYDS